MIQKRKPLTYMVYEQVYADIVNGEINSNDILTECALVERFKVSKSPVREALILLCEEEVLQSIPRIGYKVIQILPDQVESLTEVRYALEPFMLRKTWGSLGSAEIAQLEEHLSLSKEDEKTHMSVQDNWRRNIAFHILLASFAKNDYLQAMLERTLKACARAAMQYYVQVRGIPKGEVDLHDIIMQAIRDRDIEKALATLEEDMRQIV